jgi:hypothetical protein
VGALGGEGAGNSKTLWSVSAISEARSPGFGNDDDDKQDILILGRRRSQLP